MDNSENGSRRPKRTAKPVTLFSFSHDHRTAAARIKERRERGRVLKDEGWGRPSWGRRGWVGTG